jgi:putative secretion ATPase (PEP-CTERM system associated)
LSSKPFQLAPDPFFFYGSKTHKRALAYLKYGLSQGEGFIIVTGDVGTGKSTLVRTLFNTLEDKEELVAAELINTQLDAKEILQMVTAAFGLPHKENEKTSLLKNLEAYFIEKHQERKRCMLIVDEAQNLPFETIEELRMLSNMAYQGTTLLQIFLLGQSEFRENLRASNLEQVRQRVTASYHLSHLTVNETQSYIEHRLSKVDWNNNPSFTDEAFQLIYEFSHGIPRVINNTCDRILLYGFLEEKTCIDKKVVQFVTQEIDDENNGGDYSTQKTSPAPFKEPVTHKLISESLDENKSFSVREGNNNPHELMNYRIHCLEQEIQAIKKRFSKEREFMRKIVQISLNFDEDE